MGYRATRHKDGTYTVHSVPVFLEHELETADGKKRVDRKWLAGALQRNRQRRASGYSPPVHVEHSIDKDGRPQKTTHAGRLKLTKLTSRAYDGSRRACLVADLERIPAKVYQRIKAGQLPYISVEVHDLDTPEIDSCALMESTVPFFRLPLLEVSREVAERGPAPAKMPTYQAGRRPVYAFRARGRRGAHVLYRLDGGPHMDGLMEKVIAGMTAALAPIVEAIEAGSATADPAAMVGPGEPADEAMPGVDELPLGAGEEMAEEGDAMEAEGAEIEEGADELGELDAEADVMAEGDEDDEEFSAYMDADDDEDEDAMYCDDGPAGKGGAPSGKKGGAVGYSALQARVAQLEGEIDARERRDRQQQAVSLAERELSDLGILSPEISQKVRTFASKGPHALAAYMAAQRDAAAYLPPTTWSGEQQIPAALAAAAADQPALATYSAKGPTVLKKAVQIGAEYDHWANQGRAPRGVSRDEYIHMNMGGA